jgi:glycosyltransferase 2 family protein
VLVRSLDLVAFGALFARLPIWFYLASLAVMLGGQVLYAWRWRLLLVAAGVRVPFAPVVRQYFIGTFVNNFFPSTVGGDLTKVYYLGREHGYRRVTASVVLDRILGIGLLAMFASATLWVTRATSPVLVAAHVGVTGIAAVAFVLLLLSATGTGGLPERVTRLGSVAVSLARRLQEVRGSMAAPLSKPAVIAQAALVVAGHFIAVTAVYVVFVTIQGEHPPSFLEMFAVVTATSVLSNIPVSLNGLGLREQLHAALLAPFGVSREAAVAISLLLFGHLVISSLIGLLLWLRARPVDAVAS